jgi:hypothetical protein
MQRLATLVVLVTVACGSPTAPPASHPAVPDAAAAPVPSPAPTPTAAPTPPAREDAGGPSPLPPAPAPADAAPAADGAAPAGPAEVRFVARVDRSDPAGPRFAWSGSTILARFTGASIGVRLGGGKSYFDVRIDGKLQTTVLATTADKKEYPLAANLGPGPHELSVFRRNEARDGATTFLGLILDPAGGALLAPPPPASRRLEIIGDSTTCGYGVEGRNTNCPFSPATENYDVTYGPVTARAVGADLVTIAWTAKGMYRNFQGDTNDTLPVLYGRTLGLPGTSAWDLATWIPHAVVINLGDNDFQKGDPGQPFVTTYTAFIHRLRRAYPDALIICAVGPKLSGAPLDGARRYVMGIVAAEKTAGDARVEFLELPQPQADGLGCGGHANIATHQRMADVLTAALHEKLGW